LKIGPYELRSPIKMSNGSKPSMQEIGASGDAVFGGYLSTQTDYNASLQAPDSYDVFDKMRLGDGQVGAALAVIKLPLLNADWYIEPGSDSAEDKLIAEFIEENLKEGMSTALHATLRQILLHLDYGSAPFEKVWMVGDDGMVHLRKLAFRHPRTITRWSLDAKGGLSGIEQTTATLRPTSIPVEKLVVFINNLEGSNYRGVSILRSAYKHHFYKDALYRVQAIAIEKRSMGVDVGTVQGEGITEARRKDLEKALMTIHSHEKQFFAEVENQTKYRIEGIQGDTLDPLPAIEHHDLRILRSLITEFIGMGSGSTGSLAMHRDKTGYTLMALGGIANNVCETTDMHLIRQWVDYNWPGVKEYPRLRYSHLEARQLVEFADAVLKFTQAGALTPTAELENAARSMLDLTPIPADGYEAPLPNSPPGDLQSMPTEQLIAAKRAVNAVLKHRREAEIAV
jgi:hypothetical protein